MMVSMPVVVTQSMMEAFVYNAFMRAVGIVKEETGREFSVSFTQRGVLKDSASVEVSPASSEPIPVSPFTEMSLGVDSVFTYNYAEQKRSKSPEVLGLTQKVFFFDSAERDAFVSTLEENALTHMRKVVEDE